MKSTNFGQGGVPLLPGLYLRIVANEPTRLVLVSVRSFLDGSRTARVTELSPFFVPGPVRFKRQLLTARSTDDSTTGSQGIGRTFVGPLDLPHHLPQEDSHHERLPHTFVGPLTLPPCPDEHELGAVMQQPFALPSEPGIFRLATHLGHRWQVELVVLRCHRYMTEDGLKSQWFAHLLPSMQDVSATLVPSEDRHSPTTHRRLIELPGLEFKSGK